MKTEIFLNGEEVDLNLFKKIATNYNGLTDSDMSLIFNYINKNGGYKFHGINVKYNIKDHIVNEPVELELFGRGISSVKLSNNKYFTI